MEAMSYQPDHFNNNQESLPKPTQISGESESWPVDNQEPVIYHHQFSACWLLQKQTQAL